MKLFLIDGSALLYRSHYVFSNRPLMTSHGEVTSAPYGVASTLIRLREDEGAEGMVMVFDVKGPNFRHELYPDYKAQRPPMPSELKGQIPRVREVVDALDIPVIERAGYEADDVLATLARQGAEDGHDVWIYSGDKDFIPLLRDHVGLLRPAGRGGADTYVDAKGALKRFGVTPRQFLDVLALMGDKVDNVPGVPGVGEKTAVKLIKGFKTLEGLMENLQDKRVTPALRKKLGDYREQLELNQKLLTTDDQVPVQLDADAARVRPYGQGFLGLARELEFQRLVDRLDLDANAATQEPAPGTYRVIGDLASLDAALADFEGRRFVLRTEGEDPLVGDMVGIAFSTDTASGAYVPVDAGSVASAADLFSVRGDRLPWDEVRAKIAPYLGEGRATWEGHDTKRERLRLEAHGVPVQSADFDTMIASYLLAPERRGHSLEVLAEELLGIHLEPPKSLWAGVETKRLKDVPVERIGEYAAQRAAVTRQLSELFADQLVAEELDHLMYDVELPLSDVLLRMEQRGVRLDTSYLEAYSTELQKRLGELESQIHELAGTEFNLNSPKQLSSILFTKLGLKPIKKTSTGFSTDVDVLTRLAKEHPLPEALLEYRQASKLLSTYADALPKLVNPRTGCLHTSFQQTVAATGRLSSADPNLQNIPIRSEMGRRIRKAFIPREEGWCFLAADYSQIELRLMAHLSGDTQMRDAFERGEDIHAKTAALVAGVEPSQVDSEMRRRAKAINFGILYGMGARALAQQISVTTKEAQHFIEEYFNSFPSVRGFIDATVEKARAEGEVRTLLGRRRRLPELHSQSPQQRAFGERIAVNTPIQGSAADLIKVAMIRIDERLAREKLVARLLLQVHDELLFEVRDDQREKVAAAVVEEMEGVFELDVPLVVDVAFGANWAQAKA